MDSELGGEWIWWTDDDKTYLVYVSNDFGARQILQFAFVHVQYFVGHLQIILIGRRAIQFDFIITTFDHDDDITV